MERLSVLSTVVLCGLVIVVNRVHGSPFFFPESDCYQPPETYTGGYDNYQRPDYQETLQEILRALQEIVYLTVRAAKEEWSQLASLWAPPCDSEGSGAPPQSEGANGAPSQSEVSWEGWVQVQSSGQDTPGSSETSGLDNEVGNITTSATSTSSGSSTNGTVKVTTATQNTTVVTQEQTVGGGSRTTAKDIARNTTSSPDDMLHTPGPVTEEIATESVTSSNNTKERCVDTMIVQRRIGCLKL